MAADGTVVIDTQLSTGNLRRDVNNVNRELDSIGRDMPRVARRMNDTMSGEMDYMARNLSYRTRHMSAEAQAMSREMQLAYREQSAALRQFDEQLLRTEHQFFQMARSTEDYDGTTQDFMNNLTEMGNEQRRVTDQMTAANNLQRASIYQNAAAMLAMSTQASKITSNYERMANPLYNVNQGFLSIADSMNRTANAAAPAALALQMLGPNANMKQLQDMIGLINQGLMRMQMVALVAAVATAVMFYGLHKGAMATNEEYKKSLEEMGAAVAKAFAPMIEVFATAATALFKFITYVAEMIIKFNEAYPTTAKVIQGFLMLIPILTLLLAPLAVGVGLMAGFAASFAATWAFIGPVVTGLAAMMGTVLLVAAAIVLLVVGLKALMDNNKELRESMISLWEDIRSKITDAVTAVVAFANEQFAKIKEFWAAEGSGILQTSTDIWNKILAVIEFVMPAIEFVIKMVWDAIKNVITGALDVIMGAVKIFSGLFSGDFTKMWEGIKQLFTGAIDLIMGLMTLSFFGALRTLVVNFAKAGVQLFKSMWDDIAKAFTSAGTAIKNSVTAMIQSVTGLFKGLYTSTAQTFGTLRTFGETTFNALRTSIVNTITNLVNSVKTLFTQKVASIRTSMTEVKVTIQNIWNDIVAWLKGKVSIFSGIGKDMMRGLATGIKSMAGEALNAITGVVDGVVNKAKSLLKINSPSKLFNQFGVWVDQGFAGGIRDEAKNPVSAITNLVDEVIAVGENAGNGLLDGLSAVEDPLLNVLKSMSSTIYDTMSGILDLDANINIGNKYMPTAGSGIDFGGVGQQMRNSIGNNFGGSAPMGGGSSNANVEVRNTITSAPIILNGQHVADVDFEIIENGLGNRLNNQLRYGGSKK